LRFIGPVMGDAELIAQGAFSCAADGVGGFR
jgi:hypothetical protein